ncbi:heme/hemin ABC transporter substrate-binding protein [Chondromyces apiculatus]|uniref:Hemin-binding periplasmic protein n=1 Tax=Chondromyces apiculatus DSM 436 TaxID=1192034 RepID=A0A017SXG9_9BACT|nr:ABC transporter substrate-binding protein [Chondromyces apiculatus]EYF01674.1 hemin-binding periplasmic protein [Chondromyces apiculatus DSM 436]
MTAATPHVTRPARHAFVALVFALLLLACRDGAAPPEGAPSAARIVSIGGPVTELVFALGAGPDVVGVDTSSLYPDEATKLPKVGYQRTIATEGILALRPTLVLLSSEAGPPTAIAQIQAAGVPTRVIQADPQLDRIPERIRAVADALGRKEAGEALTRTVTADLDAARRDLAALPTRPRVLLIYARGAGTQLVGGADTPPDALIALAGGVNAAAEISGYKAMSAEAIAAAAPDVILVPSRGLASLGGIDGTLALPGLAQTPAGKARRVVTLDDLLLLGLGPRTPAAARELAQKLRTP